METNRWVVVPVAVLALAVLPASALGGDWVIETVDAPKMFSEMTDRSLRLDAAGHPHVAYGEDHLYYARYDGTTWHYETVDSSLAVGSHAALALDGSGVPHLAYYDALRGALKCAWEDGAGWHNTPVDTSGADGYGTSLALDGMSRPHVIYRGRAGPGTFELRYASNDGSDWSQEVIDSGLHPGVGGSVVLDAAGFVHVAFHGLSSPCLMYARRDTLGWHVETVDTAGDAVGAFPSIALDPGGCPCISYHAAEYPTDFLRYAFKDSTGWHVETVVEQAGEWTSLALDGSGWPHVSSTADSLRYAYADSGGWHVETVDTAVYAAYTSLAVSLSGELRISYCSRGHLSLRHAYRGGSGWQLETVDLAGRAGEEASLAVDGSGRPHISYQADRAPTLWDEELVHAVRDEGDWYLQTVESAGRVGFSTSIAIDGSNRPHVSYRDHTESCVKRAHQSVSGWHVDIADTVAGGYGTSLRLDPDGLPAVTYYATPGGNVSELRYARRDLVGWHVETVEAESLPYESVGQYSSLCLDSAGIPHVSYYAEVYVRYGVNDGAGWVIATVDTVLGGSGRHAPLALDADGYGHIAYRDESVGELRYAHEDDLGWGIEVVDFVAGGCTGGDISLTLDSGGRPHIS
jgi:hypothetical protein